MGAPLLQQHRRPAYGTDHEPARDVPWNALPYTGLYQGVGEERDVTARLAATGATIRDVTPLALEEAALAFLSEEGAP